MSSLLHRVQNEVFMFVEMVNHVGLVIPRESGPVQLLNDNQLKEDLEMEG